MKVVLVIVSLGSVLALAWPAAASAAPADQAGPFSGKVLETTNTAGYTYVRVDTGKQKIWAAAPAFEVKAGDRVTIAETMPMPNYHSKTLNRDFDVVYFTGNVAVQGKGMPPGHPPTALPKNHPPIGAASEAVAVSGIRKAEGGKTVAEVFAERAKLDGKPTTVRGKVVKYNAQILGKNWLHLRDGTGSDGSNDLVVTTTAEVKRGDTVMVTGPVALNQDFGFGYKYPVMIENAKVVVE